METTSNQCCHSTSAQVSTASGTPAEKPAEKPAEAHTGACCGGESPEAQYGYASTKEAHLKRLRRIEGQVRGIARMVDEDKYCIDILTQVAAVSKALHAVSLNLLEEHIGHCVTGAAVESERTGDPTIAEAKVKEATAAISRLMRS
ncbi:metal-sensitive transcriptional regulator [uncultured Rothia sp.]|uniref:metal-sensitive transcriptional regulator n=1 Tax=uncultured Rothia sp. TaxID=316088 RepID=UPI0026383E6A|nr:metal-sensitive transcriptional regulator [uncultured Rothia sp.]